MPGVPYDVGRLNAYLSTPWANYSHVQTVLDATRERVRKALNENVRKLRRQDSLLLYFAGHGVQNTSGDLFFSTQDTSLDSMTRTALSTNDLRDAFGECAGQVLVFLDACNNGTAISQQSFDHIGEYRPDVISVLAAQWSGPLREQPRSVFTDSLIRGLRGAADSDSDGRVGFAELCRYVRGFVKERSCGTDLFVRETTREWDRHFVDPTVVDVKTRSDKMVARRAYQLWETLGRPADRDLDLWLRAEREVATTNLQAADRLEWFVSTFSGELSAIDDIRKAIVRTNLRGARLSNHVIQQLLETTRTSLQRMTAGKIAVELFGIGEGGWDLIAPVGDIFSPAKALANECELLGSNLLGSVEELVNRGDLPGAVGSLLLDERINAIAIWRVHVADFAKERQRRPALALYVLASDSNAFADDLARYILDQTAMLLGLAIEMGQRDEVLAPSSEFISSKAGGTAPRL